MCWGAARLRDCRRIEQISGTFAVNQGTLYPYCSSWSMKARLPLSGVHRKTTALASIAYRHRPQTTPGRDHDWEQTAAIIARFQCQSGGSRMKFLRRFLIRLSNFATRRSADQRLREEIAEHLALQIEENLSPVWPCRGAHRPGSSLAHPKR